jgi:hypothetical protein
MWLFMFFTAGVVFRLAPILLPLAALSFLMNLPFAGLVIYVSTGLLVVIVFFRSAITIDRESEQD